MNLIQILRHLPVSSGNSHSFKLQQLQPSEPLRESSECLCEASQCVCTSTKRLHQVRKLIKKSILPTNFQTGHLVGGLLKTLKLPIEYMNDGTSVFSRDWQLLCWSYQAIFHHEGSPTIFHKQLYMWDVWCFGFLPSFEPSCLQRAHILLHHPSSLSLQYCTVYWTLYIN